MDTPFVEIGEYEGKDRIFLFSEWFAGVAEKCKSVQGAKWAPDYERKPWHYPLRMETCIALRSGWGSDLGIGPRLWAWASEARTAAASNRRLAKLPDSPLDVVRELYPDIWEAMSTRGYQRSGAEFLAQLKVAADFDEPGLGKTLTSLAAVMQARKWDGRHLAICPKTAIDATWGYELSKWTDARVYAMPDGKARREDVLMDFLDDKEPGPRWLIVHPNMIQMKYDKWCAKCKEWGKEQLPDKHYEQGHTMGNKMSKCDWPELFEEGFWDSIIADECHKYLLKLRPPSAQSYANAPQWSHGMRALIKATAPGGLRIPMTGTPFRGKEENLYGILYWMDPEKNSSYWRWADTFLEVDDQEIKTKRGKVIGTHKVVGRIRQGNEKAFYDMLDSVALRRTRKEVRADLPDLEIQEKWVELEDKHFQQYMDFEDKGIAKLEDGVLESIGTLQELTRLRQLSFGPGTIDIFERPVRRSDVLTLWPGDKEKAEAEFQRLKDKGFMVPDWKYRPVVQESPKTQLLLDMLEERGVLGDNQSGDRKFIVASQWTQVLDGLRDMLQAMGVQVLMITGAVTGRKRANAVESFRSATGPRLLLLNTQAGGTSLTLDEMCDEMFVLDETWIQDDQDQLYARINNRGTDVRPRTIYLIRTKDTVEEGIALRNIEQKNMQHQILDGRRGVKLALELMGVSE